jgi:hypothetical protein
MTDVVGAVAGTAGGIIPEEIGGVKIHENIKKLAKSAGDMSRSILSATGMQNSANILDRLLTGARLDFPMVWKSSGYQPSYSLTVRLYNPQPASLESTKKYIVGPIIALMLLAVPITTDGTTYSWPYLHKIISPGVFELDPGFIQNITVIKGGDQQQISQQQTLAMADVRIDVGSLYSSMVAGTTSLGHKSRPTVKKYMDTMLQQGATPVKRHAIFDRKGQRLGSEKLDFIKTTNSLDYANRRTVDPPPSADQPPLAETPDETPDSRVSKNRQNQAEFLRAATPTDYIPYIPAE